MGTGPRECSWETTVSPVQVQYTLHLIVPSALSTILFAKYHLPYLYTTKCIPLESSNCLSPR